jgi:RNA polymerase sigma factor (TIGR02999 family)
MHEVTRILSAIEQGDGQAAEQLLPLVYDELRHLAAQKLADEKPGQTLQATGLVHEAYIRLVDADAARQWQNRRHFFLAAAEAMRRILIEGSRRKRRIKRGGRLRRQELDPARAAAPGFDCDLLDLDAALEKLQEKDLRKAQVVKLRYFAGMTVEETASALGVSVATVDRDWTYARAWLFREISRG